jgi:hypothetical protein
MMQMLITGVPPGRFVPIPRAEQIHRHEKHCLPAIWSERAAACLAALGR